MYLQCMFRFWLRYDFDVNKRTGKNYKQAVAKFPEGGDVCSKQSVQQISGLLLGMPKAQAKLFAISLHLGPLCQREKGVLCKPSI